MLTPSGSTHSSLPTELGAEGADLESSQLDCGRGAVSVGSGQEWLKGLANDLYKVGRNPKGRCADGYLCPVRASVVSLFLFLRLPLVGLRADCLWPLF